MSIDPMTTYKHGHSWEGGASREYRSWQSMIARCLNPKAPNYAQYGGRGIAVCERWRDFRNFLADMGPRPDDASLDRIDGKGGYEPANCRWATASEQNANRSTAHMITIDGETQTVTEWARRVGISDTGFLHRVRRGLTGQALLRPRHQGRRL